MGKEVVEESKVDLDLLDDEEEETPDGCCDICGMPFEECPAEKDDEVEVL